MTVNEFGDVEKVLNSSTLVTDLQTLLSPAHHAAEVDQVLPVTEASKYVDQFDRMRAKASADVGERLAKQAGEAAYTLQQVGTALAAQLKPLLEAVEEPPSPAAAWCVRMQQAGLSSAELLNLEVGDELRQSRYAREWVNASPAALHGRYQAALGDPTDQTNRSIIAYVERQHAGGWTGRALSADEAEDRQKLRQAIKATRAGRVRADAAAQAAIAALAQVDKLVERAAGSRIGGVPVQKRVTSTWRQLVEV